MRDYSVNIPKQVGRLLPYYLRGRRMILFLSAVSHPLSFFNHATTGFTPWAHTKLYELSMTAQKIRLEWHLNSVVIPEGNITLRSGQTVTISDETSAFAVCYYKSEIQDRTTAPLFYTNGIPTVTRLETNTSDKALAKIITRHIYEHGSVAGRFVINVPYSGNDTASVSRMIAAGITKYLPVGVTYRIKYT